MISCAIATYLLKVLVIVIGESTDAAGIAARKSGCGGKRSSSRDDVIDAVEVLLLNHRDLFTVDSNAIKRTQNILPALK